MAKKKATPKDLLKTAVDDPQPNCAKCLFFTMWPGVALGANVNLEGNCHRYPPVPLDTRMRAEALSGCSEIVHGEPCENCAYEASTRCYSWSFPVVCADDCCGEWRSKVKANSAGHQN